LYSGNGRLTLEVSLNPLFCAKFISASELFIYIPRIAELPITKIAWPLPFKTRLHYDRTLLISPK
jgi:hypothetical protein